MTRSGYRAIACVATLAVTRLVPLFPFNVQNFAYGVTDMPLPVYALGTFAFIVPGTALYAYGAAGVLSADGRATYLAVAACLLVALAVCAAALSRRFGVSRMRQVREPQEGGRDGA